MNYKITYTATLEVTMKTKGNITSTQEVTEIANYLSEQHKAPCNVLKWQEIPEQAMPPETLPTVAEHLVPKSVVAPDPEVASTTPVNPEPPMATPRIPEVAP